MPNPKPTKAARYCPFRMPVALLHKAGICRKLHKQEVLNSGCWSTLREDKTSTLFSVCVELFGQVLQWLKTVDAVARKRHTRTARAAASGGQGGFS